jgi:hypothetical protein
MKLVVYVTLGYLVFAFVKFLVLAIYLKRKPPHETGPNEVDSDR